MVTLTSYNSGAVLIADEANAQVHLPQAAANRLIMTARMKTVEAFVEKLPTLIPHEELTQTIRDLIETAQGSERWNLKEKFARLPTIVAGHPIEQPDAIKEVIELAP